MLLYYAHYYTVLLWELERLDSVTLEVCDDAVFSYAALHESLLDSLYTTLREREVVARGTGSAVCISAESHHEFRIFGKEVYKFVYFLHLLSPDE